MKPTEFLTTEERKDEIMLERDQSIHAMRVVELQRKITGLDQTAIDLDYIVSKKGKEEGILEAAKIKLEQVLEEKKKLTSKLNRLVENNEIDHYTVNYGGHMTNFNSREEAEAHLSSLPPNKFAHIIPVSKSDFASVKNKINGMKRKYGGNLAADDEVIDEVRSGPIKNHPWIGKQVVDKADPYGPKYTVSRVEREPTFSQMVPWVSVVWTTDENGKFKEFRKDHVRLIKGPKSPVGEMEISLEGKESWSDEADRLEGKKKGDFAKIADKDAKQKPLKKGSVNPKTQLPKRKVAEANEGDYKTAADRAEIASRYANRSKDSGSHREAAAHHLTAGDLAQHSQTRDYHTLRAADHHRAALKSEGGFAESTDATNFNPKSQGGTRKELLAKFKKTKSPKDAESARKAGATQAELKAVKEGYGYDRTKDAKKAMWMQAFERLVTSADAKHTGKIDWNSATYLFSTGTTPKEAAEIYVKNRMDEDASTEYQVGQSVEAKIGSHWVKAKITKLPHPETGNYGIMFRTEGRRYNYLAAPYQLRVSKVAEDASAGATGSASIAAAPAQNLFANPIKRTKATVKKKKAFEAEDVPSWKKKEINRVDTLKRGAPASVKSTYTPGTGNDPKRKLPKEGTPEWDALPGWKKNEIKREKLLNPKVGESKILANMLREGASVESIVNAIQWRLERQHPDVFSKYGDEVVFNAMEEVALFHAGAEELGSSDVSIMTRETIKKLETGLEEARVHTGPANIYKTLADRNKARPENQKTRSVPAIPKDSALTKPDPNMIMMKIDSAIGDSFPDVDPLDILSQRYDLKTLDWAVRKTKSGRNYYDYVKAVWQQHLDDNPEQWGDMENPW